MKSEAEIVVRFCAEGWHRWPEAPASRAYLATYHRHLFHVEVRLPVLHDEREVEFHDLLDAVRSDFGSGDFGAASCEAMARTLAQKTARRYGRACTVAVFEDGEVGASVSESLSQAKDER